jgi:hypothetical protein
LNSISLFPSLHDKATATIFSLPFLYSIEKTNPINLYGHFYCAVVEIFCDHKYFRLYWLDLTTNCRLKWYDRHYQSQNFFLVGWHQELLSLQGVGFGKLWVVPGVGRHQCLPLTMTVEVSTKKVEVLKVRVLTCRGICDKYFKISSDLTWYLS